MLLGQDHDRQAMRNDALSRLPVRRGKDCAGGQDAQVFPN